MDQTSNVSMRLEDLTQGIIMEGGGVKIIALCVNWGLYGRPQISKWKSTKKKEKIIFR